MTVSGGGEAAPAALQLVGLSKAFRRKDGEVRAVDDVSLTVHPGEVYGFLGPNGAGKSTTIRMALGLVKPSAGKIVLFGEDLAHERSGLARVGSLADGGSFYPHLSGRDNLLVFARTRGIGGEGIAALLDRVDLGADADRRVKDYSLGMKQRLGVAAALVNDPDLVILDEPTNGLDAAGIRDMRALIRSLSASGKAVFLSSHLLHEVQQLCDRVAIVARGRLIREAPIGELLKSDERLLLDVAPAGRAAGILSPRWTCESLADGLAVAAPRSDTPAILRLLAEGGVDIFGARIESRNLEDIFLQMTGESDD